MEVIFRVSEDILIACIKGEVDHHSSAPLRQTIDQSMKAFGCSHLVLDFSGVDFMDSSGIGLIMGRYRLMAARGGTLTVVGASERLLRVMKLAGLEKLPIWGTATAEPTTTKRRVRR